MELHQLTGIQHISAFLLFSFLTFLCCVPTQGQDQDAPEITREIRSSLGKQFDGGVEIEENSRIALQIETRGTLPLRYIWMQDGSILENSSSPYYDYTSADTSYSGSYQCLIENKYGTTLSLPFDIIVKVLGQFNGGTSQLLSLEEGSYTVLDLPPISHLSDSFRFEWKLGEAVLNTGNENYYKTLSNDLVVLEIPRSFNGNSYKAKIQHVGSKNLIISESHAFTFTVLASQSLKGPSFAIRPQDEEVTSYQGVEANFECVINASPLNSLIVVWYHQRESDSSRSTVTSNSKYRIDSFKRKLTITNVDPSDAGLYECEGSTNRGTPIKASARLTVYVKPTIQSSNPRQLIKDFQEIFVLPCEVQGSPSPQISWFFNGKNISGQSSNKLEIFSNGTLVIQSVDLPDSGVYQCFASNAAGEIASNTQLVVNSAKPELIERPSDKTVIEHEDTALTCKVHGGPRPEVYWSKDGVNLTIGGRIRLTGDQLLIGSVKLSDAGSYTCHAVNIKGSISAAASLTVIAKTQINKPPQNMSRIVSTEVRLECGVRNDPSVNVTWRWFFQKASSTARQEIVSGNGNKNILRDGTLVINSVIGSDSGKYICMVSSDGGNDQRTATLNVIDLPAKPDITSVKLYEDQSNSVLLNWTLSYNGDTPLTKFVIRMQEDSSLSGANIDSTWETKYNNINPSLRSLVVSNLLPARYYRFRIIAVNAVGDSKPSDPAPANEAIKMPSQPPGESPKNVFCRQGDEREIVVQWESPPEESWNGILEGYYVYYKIEDFPDGTERKKKVVGKDTREVTLTDLVYFKQYLIKVAAYNDKGPGVNSSTFSLPTRQGKPSQPPRNVALTAINSTSIQAKWLPPPYRELNGDNRGYDIQIWNGRELKRTDIMRYDKSNPTGEQSFDIVNLGKYTLYEIRIACRTVRGAGPFSAPKSLRTPQDIPGPVTNLQVDDVFDNSLRVKWQPPTEINGILTGYLITYFVKNSPSTKKEIERNSNATNNTLKDLQYETTYIITVQAKTVVGLGPPSTTEIESGFPPDAPGPASNLAVSNIKARSVRVQFIQGYNGKTSILLWIIQAQIENSQEWKNIYSINDPDAHQIIVPNLRPFTHYRLRIIKKNVVALSIPSEPCDIFQTLQHAPGMPPGDVTPRALSPTSIRIRWRQIPQTEWNGDFVSYKISYRRWSLNVDLNNTSPEDLNKIRDTTWTTVSLKNGNNIQEYTLTNLEQWLDYEIQMVSYNAIGSSQPSSALYERTEDAKPDGSPMDVKTDALSSTTIKVIWSPLPILQQNGLILGYKVKYSASLINAKAEYIQVDGADTLNITLTDLRKFVFYNIQVLAFNRKGDGVLSPVSKIRTDGDVPGPPIIIYFPRVSETSATIHWQAPDEPNGYIIEYRVSYRREDQPDSVFSGNSVRKSSNVFEHTTDRLTAETYYIFSVEARTEDGWGEPALVKVYTFSNRARPDAPFNVRIDQNLILSRSMTVLWSPGNDNYGPIRNFTIEYKLKNGDWKGLDETIGPDARSYVVSGLKPNMEYSFQVAATNDIGRSDFSSKSPTDKSDSDVPDGTPQNVTITALTTSSLKITWTAPPSDTWNSDFLMGYQVRYKLDGNPSLPWEYKITDHMEEIATGLEKGKKYICSVQASNYKGGGPWSSAVTAYMEIAPQSAPLDVKVISKSHKEIEMSWNLPPPDSTNGELTGFQVSFWRSPSNSCIERRENVIDRLVAESPAIFQDLEPYTYYCSSVKALNIAGPGPESVPKGNRTLEYYPGAPVNLRFVNISLQTLVILWQPPQKPNGIITFYQLEFFVSLDNGKTNFYKERIESDVREWPMTQLLAEEHYTFSLAAFTTIGMGNTINATVFTGPQAGSPENPIQLKASLRQKNVYLTWINQDQGDSAIYGYEIRGEKQDEPDLWSLLQKKDTSEAWAMVPLNILNLDLDYRFSVRAVNLQGISKASPPSAVLRTPKSLVAAIKASPFHKEWWFLVIVALSSVILILLLITLLCFAEKRRSRDKLKRSTTNTTVMSEIQESDDGGFPSLNLRQSRRSLGRAPKPQSNIYALSPPRPSPASITYSDDTPPLPMTGAVGGAMKPPMSEDTSSEISEKPSHLDDSSDTSDDSDDSSTDSIAKAPIPASPPPPAFSSHYNKGYTSSNGAARASSRSNSQNDPSWRFQNTNNAYTYTDSEAESSHYAFSLNNGNIVVNNVAGARTPLSGFSSFV